MKNKKLIIIFVILVAVIAFLVYFFIFKKTPIASITLNEHTITMYVGDIKKLDIVIMPIDATDKEVIWESKDNNILDVVDGTITAKAHGNTDVIVKSSDGLIFDECHVRVLKKEADELKIDEKNIKIKLNEIRKINLTIVPEDLIDLVTWTSSDTSIVTVDKEGTITGIKNGNAIIKASYGNKEEICNVTVFIPINSIKMEKETTVLNINQTETLKLIVDPIEALNQKIEWKSSNEKIVKVDSNGKVTGVGTGKATITATIEGKTASCIVKSIGYVITEDSKFNSLTVVDSYNSETLKYRITRSKGDFTLIWVEDAYKQWNSALPTVGKAYKAEELLSKEISKYSYQQKGLVATNGGFFWDGWGDSPCSPFIINKGVIVRDIENKNYNKRVYGVLGMTKDVKFKAYSFSSDDYAKNTTTKQEMLNDGVRNSFTFVGTILKENGEVLSDSSKVNRTVLCQVDENNYVIYSGGSLSFTQIGSTLRDTYNCKVAFNFDGGGSRKLYYKTASMSAPKKVFGGDRAVPDMMYFVEQ